MPKLAPVAIGCSSVLEYSHRICSLDVIGESDDAEPIDKKGTVDYSIGGNACNIATNLLEGAPERTRLLSLRRDS